MDDEYSRRIRNRFDRKGMEAGNPIAVAEGMFNGAVGMSRTDPDQNAFFRGANTASRYALPAAGVTLAGMALIDLAGQFGGGADQPEQGQLGLNNGELSTLGLIAAGVPLAAGIGASGVDMFGLSGDGGLQDAVDKTQSELATRPRRPNIY
jgi:hypothetical protein